MRNKKNFVVLALMAGTLSAAPVFYDGTTTGWTVGPFTNSAVALSELGVPGETVLTADPVLGSAVLVHNGPGGASFGGTFSQNFTVGAFGGTLSFSGWFVTEEPTGLNAGTPGLDSFQITVSGALNQILLSGDVTSQNFACFVGDCSTPASVVDPQLNFYEYQTMFMFNTNLAPGEYTLTFAVNDDPNDPDGAFDSGLFLYGVSSFDNPEPVPEPSTLFMLGGSILLAAVLKRRSQSCS